MEVPMLDEDEYSLVYPLYSQYMNSVKDFRTQHRTKLGETQIDELFRPLREEYARLTGMIDCHQNAIMHHRISVYGKPCENCGKPLRTPHAAFCAACGKISEAQLVR